MDKKAILLIGDGVSATDLRYASGFSAPDNFIFMQSGSRKICAVSALEYNRALSSALPGVEVLRSNANSVETIRGIAAEWNIRTLVVPETFPVGLAEKLKAAGFALEIAACALFPEREFKSALEVRSRCTRRTYCTAGCSRSHPCGGCRSCRYAQTPLR